MKQSFVVGSGRPPNARLENVSLTQTTVGSIEGMRVRWPGGRILSNTGLLLMWWNGHGSAVSPAVLPWANFWSRATPCFLIVRVGWWQWPPKGVVGIAVNTKHSMFPSTESVLSKRLVPTTWGRQCAEQLSRGRGRPRALQCRIEDHTLVTWPEQKLFSFKKKWCRTQGQKEIYSRAVPLSSDGWLPWSSAHEQVFTRFTHWLVSAPTSVWEKEFLLNLWAWVACISQRTWEHFVTKICFQFEDILKMFMVTCCTSVWNHFPKSLSEWTHFFLFCCWNVRSVGQPWLQALCGSSEPSTNLRNKHKRKDIPLGFLLMMCLKVISCFKVLLWMGTIAPCVQLYCLITQ